MKIILSLNQIKKILAYQSIKQSLILRVGKITKQEIEELTQLLKKKKKD